MVRSTQQKSSSMKGDSFWEIRIPSQMSDARLIQVCEISNERNRSFCEQKSEVDLHDSQLTGATSFVLHNDRDRPSGHPAHSGHNSTRLHSEANHLNRANRTNRHFEHEMLRIPRVSERLTASEKKTVQDSLTARRVSTPSRAGRTRSMDRHRTETPSSTLRPGRTACLTATPLPLCRLHSRDKTCALLIAASRSWHELDETARTDPCLASSRLDS